MNAIQQCSQHALHATLRFDTSATTIHDAINYSTTVLKWKKASVAVARVNLHALGR